MCDLIQRNSLYYIQHCESYENSQQRRERQYGSYGYILILNKTIEAWSYRGATIIQDIEGDINVRCAK
jgi:hypothetical protein